MTEAESTEFLVRTKKEESAYIYAIFEACENLCLCSTRPHAPGSRYRDVQLSVPIGMVSEVEQTLSLLNDELEGEFYVIRENNTETLE